MGKLEYLKEFTLKKIKICPSGGKALVRVLPSLQLLEKIKLSKIHLELDQEKLFEAIRKLKYQNELSLEEITGPSENKKASGDVQLSLHLLQKMKLFGINLKTQKGFFDEIKKSKHFKEFIFESASVEP